MLLDGEGARSTALTVSARAVSAARLGGIDAEALLQAGLDASQAAGVLERSFDCVAQPLDATLRIALRQTLQHKVPSPRQPLPNFVQLLRGQPRAGATRPGRARIVMLPAETHSGHCAITAVYAVLLAPRYGADIVKPFLSALIHHAHNSWLPDAGFTGEEMLGEYLPLALTTLRAKALLELPETLRQPMQESLAETEHAGTAEARTFHAADVIDRVVQMRWYEQAARFTLKLAMDDMELVHAGPVQSFHQEVLREAGL